MADEIEDEKPAVAVEVVPVAPAAATVAAQPARDVSAPIVVDLGRCRRKLLAELKRGEGPLVKEVDDVVEQVRATLAKDLQGKTLVPVVMIYKQKRKRRRQSTPGLLPPS